MREPLRVDKCLWEARLFHWKFAAKKTGSIEICDGVGTVFDSLEE